MAKNVIDLERVKNANRLLDEALEKDPHILERLTIEDITMAFNAADEKAETTLVTVRLPTALLAQFDELVRARAFREGRRVTRNSAVVEAVARVVAEWESNNEA